MSGRILALLLVLAVLSLSITASAVAETPASTLYVKKVENLPEGFIFGMDISSVIAEENSGVKYYDFNGEETDLFRLLADNGINYIRVRVWNHPFDEEGHGFGGGNCDIENAVKIGKRATAAGMKLLVDFHYSDFWADPGKQMVPLAWKDMKIKEKTEAVYQFTRDCLLRLKEEGVDVGMVQTGNETNGKMCGEKNWFNIQYLMQAGARATREVYPDALVALHFANPENAESYASYASKMDYYQVDYDVFATSYYPYWHGTLENLSAVLTGIATTYGKQVMVVETSWAWTDEDSDFSPNTIGSGGGYVKNYPFTPQGQANSIRDITDTVVNGTPAGIGVVYWEGAWITVGGNNKEENQALWEEYGSGWASSYAASYDPDDAGKYYGGSAVDNQTFFDASGHPLESLKVFRLMREGNETEVRIDGLEDAEVICDLNAPVTLPETVDAVMSDNSRQAVPVDWNISEEELEAIRAEGAGQHEITGTAGGMDVRCSLSLVEYNYLVNDSFEEGDAGWVITDRGQSDELFVEDKKQDSRTGTKHLHFWSSGKNSVDFTAEQVVTGLPEGNYRFSVSVMGGDCGETDIYAYVLVNGETAAVSPQAPITGYNNWHTAETPAFACPAGAEITVGISVKCEGTGSGAWGKIDDATLNSVP